METTTRDLMIERAVREVEKRNEGAENGTKGQLFITVRQDRRPICDLVCSVVDEANACEAINKPPRTKHN